MRLSYYINTHETDLYLKRYMYHKAVVIDIAKTFGKLPAAHEIIEKYGKISIENVLSRPKELSEELVQELTVVYNEFTVAYDGRTVEQIVDGVKRRFNNKEYCFQGGFGHNVYSAALKFPCHWCIKPEYYNTVFPSNIEVAALKMANIDISINAEAHAERWSS